MTICRSKRKIVETKDYQHVGFLNMTYKIMSSSVGSKDERERKRAIQVQQLMDMSIKRTPMD